MIDPLLLDTSLFGDDAKVERKASPPRRSWTPGFREQVDGGVRSFRLAIAEKEVAVALEYRANGTSSSVWDAGVVLAKFLEREPPAGLDVVELGCGTGFVGLCAETLGARRVTLTDLPSCLALAKRNCPRCHVMPLPWGTTENLPRADLVLCADCLLPGGLHLFEPLRDTVVAFLRQHPKCVALVAFEERMPGAWTSSTSSATKGSPADTSRTTGSTPPSPIHTGSTSSDVRRS
eukprot:CAMPEP_0118908232 /NCGR_PEP_ID=MMETSP1166-20130328/11336_1 /TAXON_ID=1104430 /ORGANISM="Chrysoreinhardia sp, Strain CCMP3193" /LENGTH=233 /DNA_ID=CAMNT_0006847619 /DNA_START=77 /DNA_END=779 /DNA_ORIENTATION=+